MKLQQLSITGTNCGNCKFIDPEKTKKLDKQQQNEQGGSQPETSDEMKRAKKADLVTLPGTKQSASTTASYCTHNKVKQYVTARMCCAFWDAEGTYRPWEKESTNQKNQK